MSDEEPDEFADGEEVINPDDLKNARPWLRLIEEGKKSVEDYNTRCDNIDRLFANLERLGNPNRDREMALFWANISVLAPSIYARPPVPVIMPRFKDRKPLVRTASELLERCSIVGFELTDLDGTFKLVRDDLARLGRGVVWQRYETKDKGGRKSIQKVCDEYKHRKDFLTDPARNWGEVGWVAAAAYLTKSEMRKRFRKHSGNEYKNAAYAVRKDENNDNHDSRLKAQVWELWSKSQNKVVWVAEGCEKCLEVGEPHLELDNFFPCPKPAYGTVQPNSLVPVPDVMQYRDQLEEINELTNRIAALSEAVKVRAFYPAGVGEIGDAIEAAIKTTSDNVVMVPVANWAMLGNGNPNDMLVWLPLEMIVNTIAQLVELRRQLIQDVYEISGISDILRGQTDPNETLGAQELKAQTGSTRIRDKQQEMVRLARDVTRISAEIMAEEFTSATLLEMSQLEIPTDADIAKQVKGLEDQGKRLKAAVEAEMAKPEVQAMAQQNPDEAKQALQQAEQQAQQLLQQIDQLKQTITIEQVMDFLRDQKLRPFVLDIETDSTIVPDENAQKQRATEYITSMTGLLQQLIPAVNEAPQIGALASEMVKYVNGVFRVGREFEPVVTEFADQMKALASAPKNEGPNPDQIKAEAEAKALDARTQIDAQKGQTDAALATAEAERITVENAERAQALATKQQTDALELEQKRQEAADAAAGRAADIEGKRTLAAIQADQARAKGISDAQAHAQAMEIGGLNIVLLKTKIEQANVQTDNSIKTTEAGVEATKTRAAAKPAGGQA